MGTEATGTRFLGRLVPDRTWATVTVLGAVLVALGTTLPWVRYQVDDIVGPPSVVVLSSYDGSFAGIDGTGTFVLLLALATVGYVYRTRGREASLSVVAVLGAMMAYQVVGVLAEPASIDGKITGKYVHATTFRPGGGLFVSLAGSALVLLAVTAALAGRHLAAQVETGYERPNASEESGDRGRPPR